jgi:hypothetical protein
VPRAWLLLLRVSLLADWRGFSALVLLRLVLKKPVGLSLGLEVRPSAGGNSLPKTFLVVVAKQLSFLRALRLQLKRVKPLVALYLTLRLKDLQVLAAWQPRVVELLLLRVKSLLLRV